MQGSKAKNLTILSTIPGIKVPPFVVLSCGMSENESTETIHSFLKEYHGSTVAVRSSGEQEDSTSASFAGMYTTKLRVPAIMDDIRTAVVNIRTSRIEKKDVISHYALSRNIDFVDADISVIIQEMIEADISGIIFSHSLVGPDGYYLVSVSNGTGETIVGGASNGRLIRVVRGVKPRSLKEKWLKQIVKAMKAIEQHFQSTSLDVEFAFRNGALYILQCRPITTTLAVAPQKKQEKQLLKKIESLNASIAFRFRGDVLGDMIDINPLELLGVTPTPLDISIFKYLFADQIVERVRRDMGYDPLDTGLLQVVAGKPYASLRATAFSFRPFGIPSRIYERMVDVYRNALIRNPALQSRVEFDLYAMSCGEKLERVTGEAQLNEGDKRLVRDAFAHIDTVFSRVSKSQAEIFDAIALTYEQQTVSLANTPLNIVLEHVAKGTELFVRVARLAFYWKNKFEETYPGADLNELLTGYIQSVIGQLQVDLVACRNGKISRKELIRRYGHLRPGQFSVFSESYADNPDTYLFAQIERAELTKTVKRAHPLTDTVEFKNVVTFMQARERTKSLFAQSLHLFAVKLKSLLVQRGISEHDASSMSWKELDACLRDLQRFYRKREEKLDILLPDVIVPGATDLKVVMFAEAMPSYITTSVVKGHLCVLEQPGVKANVTGALVLLPTADPGYDFLFHSGAIGIITKVGGPASHMCIRAIELQTPACIGCGESMYQRLVSAQTAVLDCASRQIIVL